MTVIRKRSPPIPSEMIIISVILEWCNDLHLKKPCRFIFDLWRIYPFIFKWYGVRPFGMTGCPSFRNDREKNSLRLWQAHFLISEVGGFTSYHIGKECHFSCHWKNGVKVGAFENENHLQIIPKFYHFRRERSFFMIFDRLSKIG